MAWVERLPSGKWRGCWRDPSGSKCYTRRPDFPEHPYARKRDALEAAQEAEVLARRKAAAQSGRISASVTFAEWWDTVCPRSGHSNAQQVADSIARNYLIPQWGETSLNDIGQKDAKSWILDLLSGREINYVQTIWGQFRRALNLAVDEGVLTASPCVGVKLPTPRRKAKSYIDDDYLDSLSSELHPRYQAMNKTALKTGLRPGEMCGLHADVVDLDAGWAQVRCVYVDNLHVIRGWPKDQDVRMVPLLDDVVTLIREQLADRDLEAGCGVPHLDGSRCRSSLVFLNARGRPVRPQTWRIAMRAAAERANEPVRSPYALRRGFATAAARGGVDAFELAALMGHADVRQTREYVQQSPAARDRLRAALGDGPRLAVVRGAG